ncbi:hypothetical protein HMPREF9318_01041 [Streptococcus urinalis FB127-CNA-2]|uniref:V-type sodium ATPase, I subunit n=1 Tax=Streptococcus urinalis 2285-97 TaxID=764291 RepID=G5KHA4_9STRE|nr:V-type ATP synthase subunit I [Streptococcus urinalis]EHJ56747.1 V-type sodium ATPase, I subunit [Streptococcus urinalis 2285-97]EKS21087.1 hypothetical protein HMPREF9318_01041 [Streptococcus urinalis FB127-CNA-2]VEF31096.1 V-type H+-transporting ATPase subunit I [Streptococcus urinalis]
MAISQMKKLSIIFGKEHLDAILSLLQCSNMIEIRDVSKMINWQEGFETNQVFLPIGQHDSQTDNQAFNNKNNLTFLEQKQNELENTMTKLNSFLPKKGMLANLKTKDKVLTFEELQELGNENFDEDTSEEILQKINQYHFLEKKIEETQKNDNDLEKWRNLSVSPNQLKQFTYLGTAVGTIPNTENDEILKALEKNDFVVVEEVFHTEFEHGLLLFWDKNHKPPLDDYQFNVFDYEYDQLPKQLLENDFEKITKWQSEKNTLYIELQQSQKALESLQLQTEYILSISGRQEVKQRLASTKYLVALEGWIEAERLEELRAKLDEQYANQVLIQESFITEEDIEEVPIKLKNHGLIEPFEIITEMYSLPKYNEKDPTPILAPFYFTFFGMMVADLGYGLLLFLVTFLAQKRFYFSKGMARFVKFFNILSVSVALWGLVYGSFFGYTLPFVLISTTTDVMTILILSVAFGFITLLTGLYLGGRQKVRIGDFTSAYNEGFAWCLILLGILLLVLGMFIPGLSIFSVIGKWLAIANAVGILLVSIMNKKSLLGLGTGLYNLYNASGYVGDLVSFTRLMALGLSGASIGSAFNLIVGLFPPVGRFTVGLILFIFLHAINIFLSLLSGYVHGARLIFVEFFGKFYEGGGKPFQPFKTSEKYIKIHSNTQVEEK